MTNDEIIDFFSHCNFNTNFPIIEGVRFYSREEISKWLDQESEFWVAFKEGVKNEQKKSLSNNPNV